MSDAGSLDFIPSEGNRPVVVYDSCILYPAPVRDIFIELAAAGVIRAHWSSLIHEEWTRNVIADKRGSKRDIERTRMLMDLAIPGAITTGFEHSIARFCSSGPHRPPCPGSCCIYWRAPYCNIQFEGFSIPPS